MLKSVLFQKSHNIISFSISESDNSTKLTPTGALTLLTVTEIFVPVFFEPTDRRKAVKPLKAKLSIAFSSPNINELRAMANYLIPNIFRSNSNDLNEVLKLATIVSKSVEFLIVTLGEKGVLTVKNAKGGSFKARFYPATVIKNIENVSGAGDCFTSGFITGMLTNNKESVNVNIGYQCAKHALLCKNTVPANLSMSNITLKDSEYKVFKINC